MFEKAEEMVFHGTLDDEPPAACRRDGRGEGALSRPVRPGGTASHAAAHGQGSFAA